MSCSITEGGQFPFPISNDPVATVLLKDGYLDLVVHFDKMTGAEKKAVQKGLDIRSWKVDESHGLSISIGGMTTIDVPLNADARAFLEDGGNIMSWYVLDGGIVRKSGWSRLMQTEECRPKCYNRAEFLTEYPRSPTKIIVDGKVISSTPMPADAINCDNCNADPADEVWVKDDYAYCRKCAIALFGL